MDITTSITVLVSLAAVLWFANKFLVSAKVREGTLKDDIKQMVAQEHQDMRQVLDKFTKDFKEDINTLTQNQVTLNDNLKNINQAVTLTNTQGRGGLISQIQAAHKTK